MTVDFSDLGPDVVGDCFAETLPLDVIDPGPAIRTGGRNHTPPSQAVPVVGVVGSTWPISGFKISQLTDGKRRQAGIEIFTVGDPLRVTNEDDGTLGTNGHIVTVDSVQYEVIIRQNWTRGNFSKYVAVSIKRNLGI